MRFFVVIQLEEIDLLDGVIPTVEQCRTIYGLKGGK
jgi:hypothetical protein